MDGHALDRIAQSMAPGTSHRNLPSTRYARVGHGRGVGEQVVMTVVTGILAAVLVATTLVILAPVIVPLLAG